MGQNLAASAGFKQNGAEVVGAWMSEEKDYNPANPSYSHFTRKLPFLRLTPSSDGHCWFVAHFADAFTRFFLHAEVVWKSTTAVGCYQATCTKMVMPDGSEVFPNYSPSYMVSCRNRYDCYFIC